MSENLEEILCKFLLEVYLFTSQCPTVRMIYIYMEALRLNQLTPMIFNAELTHLSSEASIYSLVFGFKELLKFVNIFLLVDNQKHFCLQF